MLGSTEDEITKQMLRSRFDAYVTQRKWQELDALIDLTWEMGFKLLAAQMVITMTDQQILTKR